MDLQPDMILNERYRIIEKLGQGGMGSVFLAQDLTLETHVAVKSNFNPAPESVAQFLQEAQLLAALHHPNLPRVTDYFVIGKEQYLVMDYIPGEDLGQRIASDGRQPIETVLAWASQLSDALIYMHQQDPPVTHRDIKPANIKLNAEGEVILVDFGIAKAAKTEALTSAGATGYTPGYAPPEQYGRGRTGPYSDLFSLAATLYILLTGVKPADSLQRVLGKATLISLKDLNPEIPLNVSDAILKAMALQPGMRFDSVDAFQEALHDPGFRLDDAIRKGITTAIPEAMIGGGIGAQPPGDGVPKESGKNNRRWLWITLGLTGGLMGLIVLGAILLAVFLPRNIRDILSLVARRMPTPTITSTLPPAETPLAIALEPASTSTTVLPAPTETPTATPTPTPTEMPTSTPLPELLGESGWIAFASDRGGDGFVQIWKMRVVRSPNGEISADSFTQLTFDAGDKDQPVWSPDGTRIAYVAFGEDRTGLDIWVLNADGSDPVNISWGIGDEFDPEWSPDGERIIFTHHTRDSGEKPIYALSWVKADGSDRAQLSLDFVEYDPTFSPDGKWLLYVISAKSHHYFHFRSAQDDYQTPRGFDLRDIFGEFGEVSDPAWAPLGNQFAYTRHEDSQEHIVLVTYESVQPNGCHHPSEYVLTDTGADTDADWSPDARWFAFTSTRDAGDSEVYVMTTTGRPQVNLTDRVGIDRSPSWAPVLGE